MGYNSWDNRASAFERNPVWFTIKTVFAIAAVCAVIGSVSYAFGWCGETAKVAQDEFGTRAALDKYTWLKDAHAQLDKKLADIRIYEARNKALEMSYNGVPRNKWSRDDREQSNIDAAELAGIKASYNDLAAQYNAKMSEVQWRFANRGQLPAGATETLPREYAPYISE